MTQDGPPAPVPKKWLYGSVVALAVIVIVLVTVALVRNGSDDGGPVGAATTATDGTTGASTGTSSTGATVTDTTATEGVGTVDTGTTPSVTTMYDSFDSTGFSVGDPRLKIVLYEVVEPQCPHCAAASDSPLMRQIVEHYVQGDRVRLQLVPLSFLSPTSGSELANRAIYAAGQQGRAWPYVHVLFSRQGVEGTDWVTDDLLRQIARDVGLSLTRFDADRADTRATRALSQAADKATELNVQGTPTFAAQNMTTGKVVTVRTNSLDGIEAAVAAAEKG